METYFLGAYWGDRKESVEQCTGRVVACVSALGKCDPAFSRWFSGGRSRKEALEREVHITPETVKELLLRGRNRKDIGGEVIEDLGFSMSLWNGGEHCQGVGLRVQCGAYTGNPNLGNSCVVELPSEGSPSERLLTVNTLLCLMRAVAESFDPDWATVIPDSLVRTMKFVPSKPTPGWLFYAANRVLPSVLIPPAVRAVDIMNRGNVAIITEEQFSPQKPEHLQAREAVQAAIPAR
jgi:Immunity protein 52